MSRSLVTGCAGFIGSHLAEALLARGDEVIGLDAFTDYYARALKEENLSNARLDPRFALVEADLVEEPLEPHLQGVVGVFHLTAQAGVRASWGTSFGPDVRANLV